MSNTKTVQQGPALLCSPSGADTWCRHSKTSACGSKQSQRVCLASHEAPAKKQELRLTKRRSAPAKIVADDVNGIMSCQRDLSHRKSMLAKSTAASAPQCALETAGHSLQGRTWPRGQQNQLSPASISKCQRGMKRALHGLPGAVMAGTLANSRFPQTAKRCRDLPGTSTVQTGPQAP